MTAGMILDGLLALLLVWLAWRALRLPDLFQAGVHFLAFGLVLAVVWLRLEAPDLALAEAAIGAGVTGALYLNTLAGMGAHPADPGPDPRPARVAGPLTLVLAGLMVAVAVPTLGQHPTPETTLPSAGKLTNPVTAVLLDIRAYDTLLETAVLVEALMGVWILGRTPTLAPGHAPPVLTGLVRLLVPVMVVVAGAVLWNGAAGTGGAFQGAALLAAAGILARLGGFPLVPLHSPRRRAALAASATGIFLAVGLAVMVPGRTFLDYPPAWQGGLVLLIESVATVSLAAVLVVLFEATSPRGHGEPEEPA